MLFQLMGFSHYLGNGGRCGCTFSPCEKGGRAFIALQHYRLCSERLLRDCKLGEPLARNVRFGSNAAIQARSPNVRFAPKGHHADYQRGFGIFPSVSAL